VSGAELDYLEAALGEIYVDELVRRWTIRLVRATRELPELAIGASVRGSLALERAARAWALLDGRGYATPDDVELMFAPVLGHRIVFAPSFIAEVRGRSREALLLELYGRCTETAPPPELADVVGARPRWTSAN
jgi:MoxR-like ATPase